MSLIMLRSHEGRQSSRGHAGSNSQMASSLLRVRFDRESMFLYGYKSVLVQVIIVKFSSHGLCCTSILEATPIIL